MDLLTLGVGLEIGSFVLSFINWLVGVSSKAQTDAYNKAMAQLDIEYIEKQTPKKIERVRELGEYHIGAQRAVVGHSAATMEGTPLMFQQEEARKTEEAVTQITEASEHAIAQLELITKPHDPLDPHYRDDPFKPSGPGQGSSVLTGYDVHPRPRKYPHFGF